MLWWFVSKQIESTTFLKKKKLSSISHSIPILCHFGNFVTPFYPSNESVLSIRSRWFFFVVARSSPFCSSPSFSLLFKALSSLPSSFLHHCTFLSPHFIKDICIFVCIWVYVHYMWYIKIYIQYCHQCDHNMGGSCSGSGQREGK